MARKMDLPIEAVGIVVAGTGPERKYTTVRLTLDGDRVTAVKPVEQSTAHKDLAFDAVRRAALKLKIPADPTVLVHARPPSRDGMGEMPCCKRMFNPRVDRMTDSPDMVTCKAPA